MSKFYFLFVGMMMLVQPVEAVVVASGGPNNTAPGGQPFWANVGTISGTSAIYLGDGWVMTANHVASSLPPTVSFGGVGYATQPGSHHRLQNLANTPTLSAFTDIVLFRLSAPPTLPGVSISAATPTVGSEVMMIGNGQAQEGALTHWNRTVIAGENNDVWVEVSEISSTISGYETTGTHEVRWGENVVENNAFFVNVGTVATPVHVISYSTRFDEVGLVNEAQAVIGDSGGGVFSFNGNSWELSGMMFAVNGYETQPGGSASAIHGATTLIADLSYYRAEILTIIPEPSVAVISVLGVCGFFRRRR